MNDETTEKLSEIVTCLHNRLVGAGLIYAQREERPPSVATDECIVKPGIKVGTLLFRACVSEFESYVLAKLVTANDDAGHIQTHAAFCPEIHSWSRAEWEIVELYPTAREAIIAAATDEIQSCSKELERYKKLHDLAQNAHSKNAMRECIEFLLTSQEEPYEMEESDAAWLNAVCAVDALPAVPLNGMSKT
jgi:hypothetical protein